MTSNPKTLRERDIPTTLRKMPTEDVAAWCESFEDGTAYRLLGQLDSSAARPRAANPYLDLK